MKCAANCTSNTILILFSLTRHRKRSVGDKTSGARRPPSRSHRSRDAWPGPRPCCRPPPLAICALCQRRGRATRRARP